MVLAHFSRICSQVKSMLKCECVGGAIGARVRVIGKIAKLRTSVMVKVCTLKPSLGLHMK